MPRRPALPALLVATLSLTSPGYAQLLNLPGLTSITVRESTGPYVDHTFAVGDPRLTSTLTNPQFAAQTNDFPGFFPLELYDVYISDANGVLNPLGNFVTTICWVDPTVHTGPLGVGHNIDSVTLNFSSGGPRYATRVVSYAVGSDIGTSVAALTGFSANALGAPDNTDTRMGNGVTRLTVGFAAPEPTSWTLLALGITALMLQYPRWRLPERARTP